MDIERLIQPANVLAALRRSLVLFTILAGLQFSAGAQSPVKGPRVLVVIAHPDDESLMSVTLYKIAKEQHGTVDLFVITNGEAGFKYSTLAEQYYHVALTEEKTGRTHLPSIRKKELKEAGKVLGISNYYFGNQPDSRYSLSEKEPLDTSWNVPAVKRKLNRLLAKNHYDYVFSLLPEESTHGQHKAATLLALDAVNALPEEKRPVIFGARTRNLTDTAYLFDGYKTYANTTTFKATPMFQVDRTATFSFKNRVNYKVIANWEIAAHKSQGFTQMSVNDGDLEEFWLFSINGNKCLKQCDSLFKKLANTPYVAKNY